MVISIELLKGLTHHKEKARAQSNHYKQQTQLMFDQ